MKKLLLTIMMFAVSTLANAAGTNVSSGFSHTVGVSKTIIDQHGSYNEYGSGVSISYSYNGDGSDFRAERYTIETDTETQGNGVVFGSFQGVNHSSSAGILSANMGSSEGTSIKLMQSSTHTDVDVDGYYIQISRSNTPGQHSYNRETGSFNSHDHEYASTGMASTTNYSSTYSSTDFNY